MEYAIFKFDIYGRYVQVSHWIPKRDGLDRLVPALNARCADGIFGVVERVSDRAMKPVHDHEWQVFAGRLESAIANRRQGKGEPR